MVTLHFLSNLGPHKLPLAPEEPIKDPAIAVGWGYSESKWVAENILLAASEKAGLHVNIVRVGQLCGSKNGHWNEKEALPAIVKTATVVHCLPDMPGVSPFPLVMIQYVKLNCFIARTVCLASCI